MDCPVSAMKRTSVNLTKILDERPRVREIDVIQEGERGRPFCGSEFSPAQDPFVADSSQLFRIVRIESRCAQFVTAPRLGQGLLPEHLRGHDPDRCAEESQVAGLGGTATLAAGFSGLGSSRETSGSPPLPLRVGVYAIIGDEEEDLGTLTGSPLPTQEARCRSGSGSCSG
jgi:hypothetical protein